MKRYPLPDLLKGFAVFLIIPVHILEKFMDYPARESLFGKSLLLLDGPLAVPLFMMVMGYFVSIFLVTLAILTMYQKAINFKSYHYFFKVFNSKNHQIESI
jgi:surface polysaccharide O-acyltransferase-like enzyme